MQKHKALLGLGAILFVSLLTVSLARADTSDTVDVTVKVPAACSLSATNNNLVKTINPGTEENIGTANLKAICNDPNGFAIYAIGYTDEQYGKNVLSTNLTTAEQNFDIISGIATSGNTSNWSMKIAAVAGDYAPTVENGFTAFSVVPTGYTKIASFDANTDASIGGNLESSFKAYIASNQAAGTYQGKVKFLLLHPSDVGGNDDSLPIYTGENIIKEEDLPATAQKMMTGQVDGDGRSIDIYVDYDGDELHFGDEIRMIGVLHGYDNCVFTVQWQRSPDDTTYEDIEGENALIYKFIVARDNYEDYYRIVATITAIEVPD